MSRKWSDVFKYSFLPIERKYLCEVVSILKYFASPSAVIDIDTSGIHALEDLVKSLQKRDVQV